MTKLKLILLALVSSCTLVLAANAFGDTEMAPPKPLANHVYDAMVGTWEGDSDMMGTKMHEKLKINWALNHQFLIMKLNAKGANNSAMKYEGMGIFGEDEQGKVKSWWFDSWGADAMATGTGQFMDNKVIMTNSNPMFNETRSFEVKGNEMIMHAKGTITIQGKTTPFDITTIYKKK